MPKFLPSITIGVLVIFTILGIVQGGTLSNALSLNAQNVDIVGITNLLLIYFVLALLIERACQVAMTSMTFLGLAPAEDKSNVQTQSMRSLIATAICLLLATGITLSGLRLMTGVLGLVSVEDINASGVNAFLIADLVLTILILSGGSDGVHQIIERFLKLGGTSGAAKK